MSKLYQTIADALDCEIELINSDTVIENIEEWDSLGQLSVLSALSSETNGATDELDLTNLKTISELENILDENKIKI